MNISRGGALIEAPWSLVPTSIHAVQIDSDHHVLNLDARVCHVRPAYRGGNFMIGLEFLSVDDVVGAQIDRVVLPLASSDGQLA